MSARRDPQGQTDVEHRHMAMSATARTTAAREPVRDRRRRARLDAALGEGMTLIETALQVTLSKPDWYTLLASTGRALP